MFKDEHMVTFHRRLAWSPDGEHLMRLVLLSCSVMPCWVADYECSQLIHSQPVLNAQRCVSARCNGPVAAMLSMSNMHGRSVCREPFA